MPPQQHATRRAPDDLLDGLGLARLKSYSSHRASSQNRYVASNDDSKRILPGEALVMAEVSGAGMITHIWATIANNEFGWPDVWGIPSRDGRYLALRSATVDGNAWMIENF